MLSKSTICSSVILLRIAVTTVGLMMSFLEPNIFYDLIISSHLFKVFMHCNAMIHVSCCSTLQLHLVFGSKYDVFRILIKDYTCTSFAESNTAWMNRKLYNYWSSDLWMISNSKRRQINIFL